MELVEYRFVKHFFGAASSPSVASFCLKKTAVIDKGKDPEVENVIKRNIFVDDLMKSVVNLEIEGLPTQSSLGLRWSIEDDTLCKKYQTTLLMPARTHQPLGEVYSLWCTHCLIH